MQPLPQLLGAWRMVPGLRLGCRRERSVLGGVGGNGIGIGGGTSFVELAL